MSDINPRVDIAFKKIFGVEENKDLLISLINSVVSQRDQVADVTLLNPYNPENFKNDKLSILDIKAKGVDGKRFNIEVQIIDEADYDKRALYYWGKLYTEQLQAGDDYAKLNKAIGIHILNFLSIPNAPKYHNTFHITERDTGLRYFKDLELHTIELKKFTYDANEELSDLIAKVKSSLDMWLAFLTRHDLLQRDNLPVELDNVQLKKALSVLEVLNFNPPERDAYEDHLKWIRTVGSGLRKAKDDAKEEGISIGRNEGIEIGRNEGVEIGSKKARITMAKSLLVANIDIELVVSTSGLSKQEVQDLYKEITTCKAKDLI